jgi:spore germination cell wall hydrolase CwlJ-like protein
MNRILRAAGLTAAALALCASATFAAPAVAEGIHSNAQAASGAASEGEGNVFSQLWSYAVAAVAGEAKPAEPGAPAARPLDELVAAYEAVETPNPEQECLANAVYFEARGEPIEGQLAVAEVVMNRAASGRYPSSLCDVITQKAQFSFIRKGQFPKADHGSKAWRKAVAIAQIARAQLADSLPSDVLWYHADYVSPSWGKRLNKQAQIGLHIFYS